MDVDTFEWIVVVCLILIVILMLLRYVKIR